MTDTSNSAAALTSALSPQEELDALVARVAALSQMALAMAKHCVDLQTKLPVIVSAAVAAGVRDLVPSPAEWVLDVARTPDQLEAAHPAGPFDNIAYHVVTSGREPGLCASVDESDVQVLGVPGCARRRVVGRLAALAYYRAEFNSQRVSKWRLASAAPAATASSLAAATVPAQSQ
ncbi:hypothetical protein C8R47DRAFT_1205381 [Mycena vitilis]|nr:hypothetical protein C8R47DRAFT_1205381 [Mycena vitilis]